MPIARPGKIVCVGLNYRDHAEEQGAELPAAPLFFAKFTDLADRAGRSDRDPADRHEVRLRGGARRRDRRDRQERLEGERARGGRRLPRRERRVRPRPPVRATGSGRAASHPTRSAPSGRSSRGRGRPTRTRSAIRAILNGETMQDSTTANLIFGIDEIISYASQTSTLEAGRPDPHRDAGRRRRLPRPAAAPPAGRRDHDRDRRRRLAHEPGRRRLRRVDAGPTDGR